MQNPSLSDRSLPPLPPKSPLPPLQPLSIPAKNKQNLHLDLSEFEGPISPSIYPPTSMAGSSAGTELPIDTHGILNSDSERPKHLRLDTTTTSATGEDGERVISPSMYIGTSTSSSRPTSLFVSSPISPGSAASYPSSSTSRPNSPSISNLSQLSVVRQRLAQIERNHSQLSAQSMRSGTPSTRSAASSPVDRGGSSIGWERREAMFHNNSNARAKRAKSKSVVISTTPGSIRSEDERERVAVPPKMKRPSPRREEERRTAAAALTRRHISSNSRRTNHRRIDDADRHVPAPPSAEATSKAQAGPSKEADPWKPLSRELVDIKAVLGGESGDATIHQMVSGLEHRMRGEHKALRSIQGGLNELGERVVEAVASASASASATAAATINAHDAKTEIQVLENNKEVIQVVKEIKARLSTELPVLVTKLEEIRKVQEQEKEKENLEKEKQPIVTLHNITKSSSSSGGNESKAVDFKPVLDKLEEIRILCNVPPKQEFTSKEVDGAKEEDSQPTLEHLQKILNLVQEDSNKQTLLSQQQADSVRYLNELNNWLEAFVNNGTSQIQGISTNVDRLCSELGLSEDSSPNVPGHHPQKGLAPSRPNLIKEIQQLMQGIQARDQNFVALQGAVHSLLEVLTVSQTQQGAESQAIAGLIDRQRHEQEALFRAFTNEISGEIKGERLRFVEAMKEATAINIQIHVEQFKQELGREVMAMTEEVGRLHREKQQVENQISDLFSFYSKHKQPEVPSQMNVDVPPPKQVHPQEREPARANIPRSQHRLLPYPRHS